MVDLMSLDPSNEIGEPENISSIPRQRLAPLAKDLGRLRDVGDGSSQRLVLRDLPPAIARTGQRGGLH